MVEVARLWRCRKTRRLLSGDGSIPGILWHNTAQLMCDNQDLTLHTMLSNGIATGQADPSVRDYEHRGLFTLVRVPGIQLRRTMNTPLQFVFYFAVKPEKLWKGLVSSESNRIIFTGADFEADMKPGGSMKWIGPGADGKRATLVKGEILRSEPPKLLQYTFQRGQSPLKSRVTVELEPETEATKLTIIHDHTRRSDHTD